MPLGHYMAAFRSGVISNLSVRTVLLDRRDTIFHPGTAGVHLALPDGLPVGGRQDEIEFALYRLLPFVPCVIRSVLLDGLVPFRAAGLVS